MKKSTTTVLFIIGSAILIAGVVMAVLSVKKKRNTEAFASSQPAPKDSPKSAAQITEPYYDQNAKDWVFPTDWKDPQDR